MCLESTRTGTTELLADVAARAQIKARPQVVMCEGAWAQFEAGEMDAYANAIATCIKSALGSPDCIVLAQGSMAVAEPLLGGLGLPVLSSPRLGVIRALELLASRRTAGL
jgi:hypothetical protein